MDWVIAAPFITDSSDRWLGAFVPGGRHRFHAAVADYHHDRSRSRTSLAQWRDYFRHGLRAWNQARALGDHAGIVTCFPQLPVAVGMRNRLSRRPVPTVAWTFNIGALPQGAKRQLAMAALDGVDLFVVHSRAEIRACSTHLGIPEDRIRFVPLQRGLRHRQVDPDEEWPFVVSMGTAQRDYRLLLSVLAEAGLPAVIVCGRHAVDGLVIPPNVEVRSGLSIDECHHLLQRARLNVVPVANVKTASGQISLLDGMMFGCPTVVSRCPGSEDYATDQQDALLVPVGDRAALLQAIRRLWDDAPLRSRMAAQARRRVELEFSDEAVGRVMGELLDEVATRCAMRSSE